MSLNIGNRIFFTSGAMKFQIGLKCFTLNTKMKIAEADQNCENESGEDGEFSGDHLFKITRLQNSRLQDYKIQDYKITRLQNSRLQNYKIQD